MKTKLNSLRLVNLVLVCMLLMTTLSSCEAIASIFKAGVWSGVIIVGLVIAVIIFIISRMGKRS